MVSVGMISPHYAKIMHDSRQVATCRRKTRTATLQAASCSSSAPHLNRSTAFSMSSPSKPAPVHFHRRQHHPRLLCPLLLPNNRALARTNGEILDAPCP